MRKSSICSLKYFSVTDSAAISALRWLSEQEGILPALETAHALAYLKQRNNGIAKDEHVIVCLSGRGDKDVNTVAKATGVDI